MKFTKRNNKPEEDLQEKIFSWYCKMYPTKIKLFHGNLASGLFMGSVQFDKSGNKRFVKNFSLLSRIKKTGSSKDFPDIQICIPVNGFHGFFLELKTEQNSPVLKNGNYSESTKYQDQLSYGLALQQMGYFWDFGIGFEHSKDLIQKYMEGKIVRDEKDRLMSDEQRKERISD